MPTFNAQQPIASTNITWVLEGVYADSDPNTAVFSPTQWPLVGSYKMRATDTGLGRTVYWFAGLLDTNGSQYSGVGPLTDIVLIRKGTG